MRSSARPLTGFLLVWLLACCVLIATCSRTKVARNEWDKRWGPLVPHETFPGDCGICHVPERWDVLRAGFTFDHAKQAGFPLEGAHAQAACLRCHNDLGPVKAYVARGCQGCHLDPHRDQLGPDCRRCHDERSWRPQGLLAEHARTRFPLTGAHLAVACELCHTRAPTGDYRGAPTQCDICHQADARAAVAVDHVGMGWLTNCERCHFPTGWTGADLRHDFFPLLGGHAGLDCRRCHTSGTPGPIPADCNSCHADDYDGAPNHVSGNYPRTCQNCHTIYTWEGATFNHRFPLRGPHDVDCSVCHQGGDTSTFNCLVCHEHNQADTDRDHSEVGGYVYESRACLQCHRDGRGDD